MASDGNALLRLCAQSLRLPTSFDSSDPASFTWSPPLTTQEQATLADLTTMASFGFTASITLAEFQAIKPNLAELRSGSALQTAIVALRTRTDAQWNALTAAQRQSDQITWLRDVTDAIADLRAVLGALLRA